MDQVLALLEHGLTGLSWPWILLILLVATYITVLSVTVYLHRCQAHRGVDLHPAVSHFMRAWLWLTTAMVTKEWVAVHRKHHARCEEEGDPHSPQIYGIGKVVFDGVELYQRETARPEVLEQYGRGTPDDWLERNLYGRVPALGPTIMLLVDVAAFGALGVTFWAIQMIWIPFTAAGVINGLGHWTGYRNFETGDTSHNLVPWGLFLGGEELHNNHHAFPSSAKFALRRFEFDSGWALIKALSTLKLAEVRRVAPRLARDEGEATLDAETLKALFTHRFSVMRNYVKDVTVPVLADEAARVRGGLGMVRGRARRLMTRNQRFLDAQSKRRLSQLLDGVEPLRTVYEFRERLEALWERSGAQPEQMLKNLQTWCREAEESGIRALQEFAQSLKTYRLQPGMA